eukprot:scaffold304_cov248-Pinguiococcus_pyrenoidosus.AAC.15
MPTQSAVGACLPDPFVSCRFLVLEFCASSGYVALPLAKAFPEVDFVLVDMNQRSVEIAHKRIASSRLQNVTVVHGLIQVRGWSRGTAESQGYDSS